MVRPSGRKSSTLTKYGVDTDSADSKFTIYFVMGFDECFMKFREGDVHSVQIRFDVIFIDGLHIADQADKYIRNAMDYIQDDGFVVLHDCNPPTEWHARETFQYRLTPAHGYRGGTSWKAFLTSRSEPPLDSCCIDSDSGVGVLSKKQPIGESPSDPVTYFLNSKSSRRTERNI